MRKSQISSLSLVSHPITNNELSIKEQKKNFQRSLNDSQLYVIAQARYPKINFRATEGNIEILITDSKFKSVGEIDISLILQENYPEMAERIYNGHFGDVSLNFKVYSDPNCYLVIGLKSNSTGEMVQEGLIEISAWQLLFYRSRNVGFISGFNNYRDFFNLHVHYIGKTSKTTYDRLSKGHHARTDILSSERPLDKNSLLSEEIIILAFKVDSFNFNFNVESIGNKDQTYQEIIDLAEKALISTLKPKYNEIKYKNHHIDFFSNNIFDSYCLSFNENIKFSTGKTTFSGEFDSGDFSNSDYIFLDRSGIKINHA